MTAAGSVPRRPLHRLGATSPAASVDQAASGIALQTTQTFGRLIASEAAKRAAEVGIDSARQDLTRAEHRRDAGMATDADVLALVVHVADLQQRAIQASGEAAVARAELNRLMGARSMRRSLRRQRRHPRRCRRSPDVAALLAEADAARPGNQACACRGEARRREPVTGDGRADPAGGRAGGLRLERNTVQRSRGSWIVGGQVRWTFSTGGAELASRRRRRRQSRARRAERKTSGPPLHVDVVTAPAASNRHAPARRSVAPPSIRHGKASASSAIGSSRDRRRQRRAARVDRRARCRGQPNRGAASTRWSPARCSRRAGRPHAVK